MRTFLLVACAMGFLITGDQNADVVLNALVRAKPSDDMPRRWLGPPVGRGLSWSGDQLSALLGLL